MKRLKRRTFAVAAYVATVGGLLTADPEPAAAEECWSWLQCQEQNATPELNPCERKTMSTCVVSGSCYVIQCDDDT